MKRLPSSSRGRAITASTYIFVMTICGPGIGPYMVGMISDATHGDLAFAIKSINWVAPVIVLLLAALFFRADKDQRLVLPRARAAGEVV